MKEYLVRLAQIHESFRTAELRALAVMAGTEMEIVRYDDDVCEFFLRSISLLVVRFRQVGARKRWSGRVQRQSRDIFGECLTFTHLPYRGVATHLALPHHYSSRGFPISKLPSNMIPLSLPTASFASPQIRLLQPLPLVRC